MSALHLLRTSIYRFSRSLDQRASRSFAYFEGIFDALQSSLYNRLLLLKRRYRQAVSAARFQLSLLRNRSSRSQVLVTPSRDWRRSPLVRFARRWARLANGAYWIDAQLTKPVRAFICFVGSLVYLAASMPLILFYWLQLAKHRYSDAAKLVHAHSNQGRHRILLFAHSGLSVPELARFAAQLAQQPEHADKVAVVVPNSTVGDALKPLAGSVTLINVQQFWLDQSIDIANHELVKRALDLQRAARDRAHTSCAEVEPCFDLFEAMSMDLHVELMLMLRLGCALQAALDMGKTTIGVCFSVPTEQQWFCQDFLRSDSRQVTALVTRNLYHHDLFGPVEPRPSLHDLIGGARARLAADLAKAEEGCNEPRPEPPAKIEDRDSRSVALISDADVSSNYWPAVINFAQATKQSGQSLRILVEDGAVARALRSKGFVVDQFSVPASGGSSQRFSKAYGTLLDELDEAISGCADIDPRLAALRALLTARLAQPETADHLIRLNHRIREHIQAWLVDNRIGSIAVLPHWGRLAWAAAGAATVLGIPSASTPAVSVAGNSASIVGWNWLSLVGCYGLQCHDAFISQGYPPDRLQLIGSLALDHALQVSHQEARARLTSLAALAVRGRRILLFATSGVNSDEHEIIAKIVQFCRDPAANAALVVRPHPSIGRAFYEEAVRAALGHAEVDVATVIFEGTAHDNIAAADVVITDFSTIGAEAVLIGRPLLIVNTTGKPFPANNYADLGVAAQANTVDEISPMLRRLADEGAFWPNARERLQAFTQAYNWGGDGQAGVRLLAGLRATRPSRTGAHTARCRARLAFITEKRLKGRRMRSLSG